MIEQDIQELYALIRGAKLANYLLDAAAQASEGDYVAAARIVGDVKAGYEKQHRRTLKQDLHQVEAKATEVEVKRLAGKQEKYRAALARCDEVLAELHRRAATQQPAVGAPRPLSHPPAAPGANPTDRPRLPSDVVRDFESAATRDAKFAVIRLHFDVRQVAAGHTIEARAWYFLRDNDRDYLIRAQTGTPSESTPSGDQVVLEDALNDRQLATLSLEKFLALGGKRRLVQLQLKAAGPAAEQHVASANIAAAAGPRAAPAPGDTADGTADGSATDDDCTDHDATDEDQADNTERDKVLDPGAFTQLMDAAVRSTLVPDADRIAQIRDREFRLGKYQKASQLLEGMFGKFTAAATQRAQRIRREEMEIARGAVKMSPKDVQMKRARDSAEGRLVDRARNRFMRVLEGLRILMRT